MTWSLWLLPDAQGERVLQPISNRLCDDASVERFPVHLTLLGRIEGERGALERAVQELARQPSSASRILDARTSEKFYQCVYLAFDAQPFLQMHDLARQALPNTSKPFNPHLSLLYGEFPQEERDRYRSAIGTTPERVTFDRLQLVVTDGHYLSWGLLPPVPLS